MNSDANSPNGTPCSPTPEEERFPDHLLEAYLFDRLSAERRRILDEQIHHDPALARRIEELRTESARFQDALAAGRQDPPDTPLTEETLGQFMDGSLSEEEREAVTRRLGGSIEQQRDLVGLFHETRAVRGTGALPEPPRQDSDTPGEDLRLEGIADRTEPSFTGAYTRFLALVAGTSAFVVGSFIVGERMQFPFLVAALGCVASLLRESSAIRLARVYPSPLPSSIPRRPWGRVHATLAAAALLAATIWPTTGLYWSMFAGLFFLAWLLDGLPRRVESYRSRLRNLRIHAAGERVNTGEEDGEERIKRAGGI